MTRFWSSNLCATKQALHSEISHLCYGYRCLLSRILVFWWDVFIIKTEKCKIYSGRQISYVMKMTVHTQIFPLFYCSVGLSEYCQQMHFRNKKWKRLVYSWTWFWSVWYWLVSPGHSRLTFSADVSSTTAVEFLEAMRCWLDVKQIWRAKQSICCTTIIIIIILILILCLVAAVGSLLSS